MSLGQQDVFDGHKGNRCLSVIVVTHTHTHITSTHWSAIVCRWVFCLPAPMSLIVSHTTRHCQQPSIHVWIHTHWNTLLHPCCDTSSCQRRFLEFLRFFPVVGVTLPNFLSWVTGFSCISALKEKVTLKHQKRTRQHYSVQLLHIVFQMKKRWKNRQLPAILWINLAVFYDAGSHLCRLIYSCVCGTVWEGPNISARAWPDTVECVQCFSNVSFVRPSCLATGENLSLLRTLRGLQLSISLYGVVIFYTAIMHI